VNKTLSTIVLIVLGILLSVAFINKGNTASNDVVELTDDNYILFTGQVTDESVAKAQIKLAQLSKKLGRNDVIYLVLDTPGGSVPAGNLFIDFAKSLPQKIKPICLFCASMGYHMFQSFDERIVYRSSTLMSHRASLGGISGEFPGELETRLEAIRSVLNQMDDVAAARVGLSRKAYQDLIHDELWLDGASAVRTKHADRVAQIRCSEDIAADTRSEIVNTMLFGPVEAIFSKCPLISGPIDVQPVERTIPLNKIPEVMSEIKKKNRTVIKSVMEF
jgi:ATP-dependent protease ClpP protease subunit